MHTVVIAVSENELIVSMYQDYLIRHKIFSQSQDDIRMSVKSFSDHIQQYLIDRYNLDEEETNV